MRPLRRAAWRPFFFFLFLVGLFSLQKTTRQGRSRVRRSSWPCAPLFGRGPLEGTPPARGYAGAPPTAVSPRRASSSLRSSRDRRRLGGLPHDSSCDECAGRQKGLEGGCFCTGGRAAGGGPRATGREGWAGSRVRRPGRGSAALCAGRGSAAQVEGPPPRSRVRRPLVVVSIFTSLFHFLSAVVFCSVCLVFFFFSFFSLFSVLFCFVFARPQGGKRAGRDDGARFGRRRERPWGAGAGRVAGARSRVRRPGRGYAAQVEGPPPCAQVEGPPPRSRVRRPGRGYAALCAGRGYATAHGLLQGASGGGGGPRYSGSTA
jgi:hypothetical protein